MQPNIVLIPNKKLVNKIFHLRRSIITNKLGEQDARRKVLPHSTICYFEEELCRKNISTIINKLNQLNQQIQITLDVKQITNWDQKIIALLDIMPLSHIKNNLESLIDKTNIKFNVEYKQIYGDTIGNHMKLVREVHKDKINAVIEIFIREIPKKITFNRIALIGYESEEKDVLWQKILSI
jgi:2'-5' RNA ligase